MDKPALWARHRERLLAVREELLKSQAGARAGTRVDGDHRPANRGERAAVSSQGYLAAGIQARLSELDAQLALLDRMPATARTKAGPGALVEIASDDGEQTRRMIILPGGSGEEIIGGLQVVDPQSPPGRALLGAEEDDEVEWSTPSGTRIWVVLSVR